MESRSEDQQKEQCRKKLKEIEENQNAIKLQIKINCSFSKRDNIPVSKLTFHYRYVTPLLCKIDGSPILNFTGSIRLR